VNYWILPTRGKIKAECLSELISSGEIVVVGSRSMRVIDYVLEFTISEVGRGRCCDSESRVVNSRFVKSQ
jgi:hypothetical protein